MYDPMVDRDLHGLLALLPAFSLSADRLAEARAVLAEREAALAIPEHRIDRAEARAPDGTPVPLVLTYPAERRASQPLLLHLHGGGYVMGSARMKALANIALADALNCLVVSVDYRLAPEVSHPVPLEDCYAALCHIAAQADSFGIDPARIAVRGESAGGGLASALSLLARDRGEVQVGFQQLIYPMLDDRTGTQTVPPPHVGRHVWTAGDNRFAWSALLDGCNDDHPLRGYATPGRHDHLAGLPPTFILTGALDLFVAEDIGFARRLIEAAVATELHVLPGAFHGFDADPSADVAVRARDLCLDALRRAFNAMLLRQETAIDH